MSEGFYEREVGARWDEILELEPGGCRSCAAPVWWFRTPAGKAMPLSQAGVSHFSDCPNAGKHRKR